MSSIIDDFIHGDFAVHAGDPRFREFLRICEREGIILCNPDSGRRCRPTQFSDLGIIVNSDSCFDHGVHDKGQCGVMFHDRIRYYRENGYSIIEYKDFKEQYDKELAESPSIDLKSILFTSNHMPT